ncbi:MAG: HEAT repeat domain-containing protein [Myxococcota bacterium]|nr:HEAT repeat domain-containing protein [Myxococcota bacterium]
MALFLACDSPPPEVEDPAPVEAPHEFAEVGSCAECHADAQARWRGSHHDAAMQVAGPGTVRGDFDDAEIVHRGVTTRFRRDGGRYWVDTEGPDGAPASFEVAYTFGVEPLQQYLLRFPAGRLQSLTLAWDTEREVWFSLYPNEDIPAGDPLHWTGPLQRWNSMCAACHSTDFERGYDVTEDTYTTEHVSLDVSCQACHGPGQAHVDWARARVPGKPVPEAADRFLAIRFEDSVREVETCAPCHARRHRVSARPVIGERLLDHYVPELLRPGLYHPDGQIDGEVYVYGSFVQSKMYDRGVRCSDCHEPHGLGLRVEGNGLCTRCHATEPDPRFPTLARRAYDTPEHHFHPEGSAAARCVACHMPERTYMQVDGRRDHSLRIPRPDLSVRLGTPNPCTGCHADQPARWAADFLAERGVASAGHYGDVLAAARDGRPEAIPPLMSLATASGQPAIVRATAVGMLAGGPTASTAVASAMLSAAEDPDPLVRTVAASALESISDERGRAVLSRLVSDPVRSVRVEAARVLSGFPTESIAPQDRDAFEEALDEFRDGQLALADTPEAHLNLGVLHARRGRHAASEEAFRVGLRLQPDFVPARVNLANLLNARGRNDEAVAELRAAIASHERILAGLAESPALRAQRGEVHYSLGLVLAEMGDLESAERELAIAAERIPERGRIRYNRALALQRLGRSGPALALLQELESQSPNDPEVQNALAVLHFQMGEFEAAAEHAERLVELTNRAPAALELLEQVRAGR